MTKYSNFFSYIPFWLQQYITTQLTSKGIQYAGRQNLVIFDIDLES